MLFPKLQLTPTATLFCLAAAASAQNLKIGVINSEVIVNNYPEFRQAEAQLSREVETWQSQRSGWESEMQRLRAEIEEKEKKLQAGQNTFTPERKAALSAELDSLKLDFSMRINLKSQEEQERFNRRREELLSGVFEIVNKAIEELGDQEGYDLIIDSANGTVVYARTPDDLTDKLLQFLKK